MDAKVKIKISITLYTGRRMLLLQEPEGAGIISSAKFENSL